MLAHADAHTETALLNYFNYFTEIEERFQQRRGSILLLSTLDWALIETWQEAGIPLDAALRGIDAAAAAGLAPIKINAVIKRGMNERAIVPLARHFRGSGHILRFIEYMDVGASNGWRMDDVVPSAEVVAMIAEPGFR